MATKAYEPRFAVHPGNFLKDEIEARGMTQAEFAERTGISPKVLSQVLNEIASLQPWMAIRMEAAFGMPAEVWMNLQSTYDETMAWNKMEEELMQEYHIAQSFPYVELNKCVPGYLPVTRSIHEKVVALRRFFGVSSLITLVKKLQERPTQQSRYMDPCFNGAFRFSGLRTNRNTPVDGMAILAWLRAGQLLSEEITCQPLDQSKLSESLPRLRKICAQEDPFEARSNLRDALLECGVKTIFSNYIKGTYTNGVTIWDRDGNPTVFLTNKQTYWDTMLFSWMHELGHILRHGKDYFSLSFSQDMQAFVQDAQKEEEANSFARNFLVVESSWLSLDAAGPLTDTTIRRFANEQGLPVGIIAAQCAHRKMIPWSHRILATRSKIGTDAF